MLFCLVYALTKYSGFVLSPQVFLFSIDVKCSPLQTLYSKTSYFHYRITGELQSCHVTGRYYSMLYTLVKGIFFHRIFNFLTFRFHTLMATYRCLCSELIYHDPGRLYGGKRGRNALVHQPTVSTFLFFLLFIYLSFFYIFFADPQTRV